MLKGIGNDIVEIERIRQSVSRLEERFVQKILTERERDFSQRFADPIPHIAGRFSAKEAIVKALGVGIGKEISFHDIEIINDEKGKPCVFLSEATKKCFSQGNIFLSISHSKDYATAVAVWV